MVINLGNTEYKLEQAKLRLWLQLGSIQDNISGAVANGGYKELAHHVCQYVATALSIFPEDIENLPWEEVADAFAEIVNVNALNFEIPLLLNKSKDDTKVPWDYDGRNWYFWLHSIAKEFGWTIEYIAEMNIEDGVKILQEILVNEQMQKEWSWALSEKSVQKVGNDYKFKELPRPDWMRYSTKPIHRTVIQIPEHLMPMGNIIRAKH